MQKCYGVTIAGKVQDIGFRDLIENIARSHYLNGIVFNEKKGSSVKIVCRGDYSIVNFLDEIKTKGSKIGIVFDILDKKELSLEIPLPETFTKVNADDVEDIGRKLDKGNSELREINTTLSGVAQETHNLNIIMSSFVVDQRDFNKEMRGHNQRMDEHNQRMDEHNQRMDTHNQHLERILEKLAEK